MPAATPAGNTLQSLNPIFVLNCATVKITFLRVNLYNFGSNYPVVVRVLQGRVTTYTTTHFQRNQDLRNWHRRTLNFSTCVLA